MADNRISLRCKTCGAEIVLSKYFGGYWALQTEAEAKGRELFDFIEEHQHERYNDYPFELVYEEGHEGMQAVTKFWAPSEEGNHFVGVMQVNGLVPNLTKGSPVHINDKGDYWVVCVETTTLRSGKEDIIGQYVYLRPNPPKKKKRWFFF